MEQPIICIDFNDQTANNRISEKWNGEIVGDAAFVKGTDGTFALHLENTFGKAAGQYLAIRDVSLGDSDVTISLMYRAGGTGGFTKWPTNSFTYDENKRIFRGFAHESYMSDEGGAIFSNTDTSMLGNTGLSLLNLPSCYDGTYLLFDGENEINKREISRIQDSFWHSVVLSVKRGDKAVLYVDGAAYSSADAACLTGMLDHTAHTLCFGADAMGNYGVGNGDFDNIAIFDYALSADEVKAFTSRDLFTKEISLAEDILAAAQVSSRFSEEMIAAYAKTVEEAKHMLEKTEPNCTQAKCASEETETDYVQARAWMRQETDKFQDGRKPLKKVGVVADTHISETPDKVYDAYMTVQYKKFLEKGFELGVETIAHAGDYAQTRDDDNGKMFFDYTDAFFFGKGGKTYALCIGNHQYTHTYTGQQHPDEPVNPAYFMERCSAYVDADAEPNRKLVDENGKLKVPYYYVTDGVADYIAIDEFEGSTTKLSVAMSKEQWAWIFETLDYCKTTGRPIFIIGHWEYGVLTRWFLAEFEQIMQKYEKVSYISGDSHHGIGYVGITERHPSGDASKKLWTIDCPSSGASDCWKGSLDNAAFYLYIYEDGYALRCYNLVTEEFVPEFDTTVKY